MSFLHWQKARLLFAPVLTGCLGGITWLTMMSVYILAVNPTEQMLYEAVSASFVLLLACGILAGLLAHPVWPKAHHTATLTGYLGAQGILSTIMITTLPALDTLILLGAIIGTAYAMDHHLKTSHRRRR